MALHISWADIAIRLLLTIVAGAVIGVNRGERGHPAGLRTTILVCLAASVAMITANLLLDTSGRPADSFVRLDLMRLPQGILAGMGFIGAGAIVRKGALIHGVTTAATLWLVTVIGLSFGSGQLALGAVTLVIAFFVLWGLKQVENRTLSEKTATLILIAKGDREAELLAGLTASGYKARAITATFVNRTERRKIIYEIRWRSGEYPVDGKIGIGSGFRRVFNHWFTRPNRPRHSPVRGRQSTLWQLLRSRIAKPGLRAFGIPPMEKRW